MPVQLLSDNMDLTPSMKVLAEQKLAVFLGHIQQRSREEATIRVVMNKSQEPDKLLAKVEAKIEGKTYFGDDADYTLESALIRAVDEVDKQYLKDKDKTKERDYEKNRELKRLDEGALDIGRSEQEGADDGSDVGNVSEDDSESTENMDLNPPAQ